MKNYQMKKEILRENMEEIDISKENKEGLK